MSPIRHLLIAALTGAALSLVSSPSQALERLVLRLPFLETSVTINLGHAQLLVNGADHFNLGSFEDNGGLH